MAKAVVIVDMLNDFVEKDGALYVPGAENVVENIKKIRERAYDHCTPVIYDNDAHTQDDPEFKSWPRHALAGTEGARVIDDLMPEKGDIIIEKQSLSMFSNGDADKILKQKRITELYLAGVATEYCVKNAAIDGAKKGYQVYLVVDAISGVELKKGDQYAALLEMGIGGVKPVFTEKVLEELL